MFTKVYISQPEEAKPFYTSQNLQWEYRLTPDHRMQSPNIVLLYGLCLHLFGDLTRDHYSQIENEELWVGEGNRSKSLLFMSRACTRLISWMREEYEADMVMDLLSRNFEGDGLILMKFQTDVDFTNFAKKKDGDFVLLYFYSERIEAYLDSLVMEKILINNDVLRRKLQFLGLACSQNEEGKVANIYGLGQDDHVLHRIVEMEEEPHSVQEESVMTEKQSCESSSNMNTHALILKFEHLVFCGLKSSITKFKLSLEQQLSSIKIKIYRRGDEELSLPMFSIMCTLTEKYRQCKMFLFDGGEAIHLYYIKGVEDIVEGVFQERLKGYELIDGGLVKGMAREIAERLPDMVDYESESEDKKLLVNKYVKQYLTWLSQPRSHPSPSSSPPPPLPLAPHPEFSSNLQLSDQSLPSLFKLTSLYKLQEEMNFRIDVGDCLRIVNRVKKCQVVYLLFRDFVQLMELQAIVEEEVQWELFQGAVREYQQEVMHGEKELLSKNGDMRMRLVPLPAQTGANMKQFYIGLLKTVSQQKQIFFKTIICSPETLEQLLSSTPITFTLTLAVNQPYPFLQLDSLFDQQTEPSRTRTGKTHSEYYFHLRTDITNRDYKEPSNLRKEEGQLRDIFMRNGHQYQIGDYLINELDQWNIAYMLGEGLKGMFFVLSKKPEQEYVYLVYFQKLYRVFRDKSGQFQKLGEAAMKDISRANQAMLRPAINRAFITGQKYLSISIPFQHIKLVHPNNITRLSTGNSLLLHYYLHKLSSSQRYKLALRPPCTLEHFQHKFAKKYTLRFQDQMLRKQIKGLDLGYGNVRKWRDETFVCLNADHYICEKLLRKFLVMHERKEQEDRKKEK